MLRLSDGLLDALPCIHVANGSEINVEREMWDGVLKQCAESHHSGSDVSWLPLTSSMAIACVLRRVSGHPLCFCSLEYVAHMSECSEIATFHASQSAQKTHCSTLSQSARSTHRVPDFPEIAMFSGCAVLTAVVNSQVVTAAPAVRDPPVLWSFRFVIECGERCCLWS